MIVPLVSSCSNSSLGETLQRSLAPDPRLENNPAVLGSSPAQENSSTDIATLPDNFPDAIPRYPGAKLVSASPSSASNTALTEGETRWSTPDTAQDVEQFYRNQLLSDNWTLQSSNPSDTTNETSRVAESSAPNEASASNPLTAEQDGLSVTVAIEPLSASPSSQLPSPTEQLTEFTITYSQQGTASQDDPLSASAIANNSGTVPKPGDPNFVGPLPPFDSDASNTSDSTSTPTTAAQVANSNIKDINQAPSELRNYVEELAQLGVFSSSAEQTPTAFNGDFKPNDPITRRDFAQWLVAANNAIYGDRPSQQIRLGLSSDQPAFKDVPTSDPDFPAIQGLAKAGLIPSPLSGDTEATNFRPDAPLTRESLLLWKVPADIRQPLPNATVQAVQDSWGFQDAARIDPRVLKAVLADYQNGDFSNIRRAFGFTTLLQPKQAVTRAEAAAALWYFGSQNEGLSAADALKSQNQQ